MSPLNSSPSHQSSSGSTTPPSEATLNDETQLSEAMSLLPESYSSTARQNLDNQGTQPDERAQDRLQRYQALGAINTDYESSAAEDYDIFTTSKYENAEFALLSYSRTNKFEKLQKLLDAKLKGEVVINLNFKGQQKQNSGWTALHLACYFGHTTIVEYLLSKKVFREEIDINIQNHSGDTPLHKAALTNRIRIVQLLLSNGAKVLTKNCDGLSAKQLTKDRDILDMLEAAERVDKNRAQEEMFKAVDNGDLRKLQEYFESYSSYMEASSSCNESAAGDSGAQRGSLGPAETISQSCQAGDSLSPNDRIGHMNDDRGNTLLHLAAMRGFKAICIYLLEQGLDPYRKNSLGQTCIDLSSYQLQQLFTTVKPASSQLKKLSSQRVIRFEGPLLKKVRILGWKQIYVALENGVILLFNNRRDSINKSRRGYKYLESASCEPDPHDLGTFTVCFSDKSRATFLVTADQLNNYASFKPPAADQDRHSSSGQIELVRQKWIDAIRDHIRYSTEFIRKGLRFNDEEQERLNDSSDLSNLNHLLPIDTIKSFVQEARAHYSILERHAESLCSLVQSINSTHLTQSMDGSPLDDTNNQTNETQPVVSSTTTGSRILGFIRPSRQARGNSISQDDSSPSQYIPAGSGGARRRNNSLTSEFVQDNWHCVLFHLRLLMESSENTKTSMGQALALLEHQEQLRQERLQNQEERCRVLEDSLHALARDHHELEKSISMSQIYHSAAARSMSMSMSTDLNEYFDAFEDFDDEKTMTPTSMPSDEDLNRRIQDVMNEEQNNAQEADMRAAPGEIAYRVMGSSIDQMEHRASAEASLVDDDEDDLRSNCSALTMETISDMSTINACIDRNAQALEDTVVSTTDSRHR